MGALCVIPHEAAQQKMSQNFDWRGPHKGTTMALDNNYLGTRHHATSFELRHCRHVDRFDRHTEVWHTLWALTVAQETLLLGADISMNFYFVKLSAKVRSLLCQLRHTLCIRC